MDRGAWQATVQGITQSRTQLSTHAYTRTQPSHTHTPGKRLDTERERER